jgi:hypothetical protein
VLVEERAQLRQLCESAGWKRVIAYAQESFDTSFENDVIQKPSGVDDLIAKTWQIGECAGLRRLINIPQLRLEVLEGEIRQLEMALESVNEQGVEANGNDSDTE